MVLIIQTICESFNILLFSFIIWKVAILKAGTSNLDWQLISYMIFTCFNAILKTVCSFTQFQNQIMKNILSKHAFSKIYIASKQENQDYFPRSCNNYFPRSQSLDPRSWNVSGKEKRHMKGMSQTATLCASKPQVLSLLALQSGGDSIIKLLAETSWRIHI